MALGIDGLISGIDTTAMIKQLMEIEARPQVQLKDRAAGTRTMVSALQGLNTRIAALAEKAAGTAKPAGTDLYTAAVSSDKATAAVTTGAAAGSLDFQVAQTARAQVSLSAALSSWPDGAALSISAAGDITTIDTANKSLDEVVSEVNKANLGVAAVKIAAGSVDGVQQYRIQFTATKTGTDGAFEASLDGTPLQELHAARDARITLWAGTPAAQDITSSTNTFTALMPGVDLTLAADAPVGATATLAVSRDDAAISKVAQDLVASLADAFDYINRNSAVTVTTTNGSTAAAGGLFTADSGVRDIKRLLMDAATGPLDGVSPSAIGIEITKYGTVEFNAEKFAEALAADPAKTQDMLRAVADRVAAAGTTASDKYDGMLTKRIQGQESTLRELTTQIEDWDRRLASRESTLKLVWTNLEVKLSQLQSQQDWLTGQLAALNTSGSKK